MAEKKHPLRLILAGIAAAMWGMTQNGPDEAVVNFCKWPKEWWFHSWPDNCLAGAPSWALYGVIIVLLVGALVWFFWPNIFPLIQRHLTLREATQSVYDTTRHGMVAGMSRVDPADNPLLGTANLIFQSEFAHVTGRLRASTKDDEIPLVKRRQLCVCDDLENARYPGTDTPEFYFIKVRRRGLAKVLSNIARLNKALS